MVYGGGMSDTKYKQYDVLISKDATFNENILEFMAKQYGKMIISKVTFVIYNLNVMNRVQQDGLGRLDYRGKSCILFQMYCHSNIKMFAGRTGHMLKYLGHIPMTTVI